jgi:hypothetical protein
MHRDHWILADERTKVFRLIGCSLSPIAYRPKPLACFGEFDLDRVLGGLGVCTRRKTLVRGLAASLRFHW